METPRGVSYVIDDQSGICVERIAVKHHRDLLRFLCRRVRNIGAPDLAQDVYCGLLRLARKDAVRDEMAYVYTVAANLARAHLEKLREQTEAMKLLADEGAHAYVRSEEHNVDAKIQGALLRQALAQLKPSCRAVVILHRRDGMTYEEISELLDISIGMVKKYLGAGVRHCNNKLRDAR